MRFLRRATAVLAALSLVVSTTTGATMACGLEQTAVPAGDANGGTAAVAAHESPQESAASDHGSHEHHAASPAATSADERGAVGQGESAHHAGAQNAAAYGAGAQGEGAADLPASPDPHHAKCPAMGPCALALLGAPSSVRASALRAPVRVIAASETAPHSRTLVPDLPPPKA